MHLFNPDWNSVTGNNNYISFSFSFSAFHLHQRRPYRTDEMTMMIRCCKIYPLWRRNHSLWTTLMTYGLHLHTCHNATRVSTVSCFWFRRNLRQKLKLFFFLRNHPEERRGVFFPGRITLAEKTPRLTIDANSVWKPSGRPHKLMQTSWTVSCTLFYAPPTYLL